jgi:integrase
MTTIEKTAARLLTETGGLANNPSGERFTMSIDLKVSLFPNGKYWQAKWRDSSGRPKAKGLGPRAKVSRRAAEKACRLLADAMAREPALRDAGKAPTLREWIDRFFVLRGDLEESTVRAYRRVGDLLIEHFGADRRLDLIGKSDAANFRVWLEGHKHPITGQSLAENTRLGHLGRAKKIMAAAVADDKLTVNPFRGEKTTLVDVEREIRYITEDEAARILAACPDESWRLLFALCRLGGLRRGEALRLRWEHVDWNTRMLTVWPKKRKKTKKQRFREVPMRAALYDMMLQAFGAAPAGQTLVCPMPLNNLDRDAKVILRRAGIPPYAKAFHTLRANCDSEWQQKVSVMTASKIVGHAPEVAQKFYVRVLPEEVSAITGVGKRDEIKELRAEVARLKALTGETA